MREKICIALFLTLLTTPVAFSTEIQGIQVPPLATVNGQPLALNGAGLRTVKIAFIPIKAYIAAVKAIWPNKRRFIICFSVIRGKSQAQRPIKIDCDECMRLLVRRGREGLQAIATLFTRKKRVSPY